MGDEERINPGHGEIRRIMRVVGPLVAGVGIVFIAVGMISFFTAFGTGSMPQYFWCCFVGAPILALGSALTKFAYMGAMFRYLAGEVAPVQKDTFNYLANGVRPGVKDLTQAVAEGLQAGFQNPPAAGGGGAGKYCVNCGHALPLEANFCSACGQKLN